MKPSLLIESGDVYFEDGYLVNSSGQRMFTHRRFDDAMDAAVWLLFDDNARFCCASLTFGWRRYADTEL